VTKVSSDPSPAQAQDWWRIFVGLAGHASLILLYIEDASPTLLREMQYLAEQRLRYAIVASEDTFDLLRNDPTLGTAFLSRAVTRLKPNEASELWARVEAPDERTAFTRQPTHE